MEPINNRDLERLRDTLASHEVEYLLIGKMAAIVQGFPDTTQDADLFIERSATNDRRLVSALRELGFALDAEQVKEIERGKDFIQLRTGPFDIDIVHAPDGIEHYRDARKRAQQIDGYRICTIEDVIESKRASGRAKDRETLPRLRDFAIYLKKNPPRGRQQLPPQPRRTSDRKAPAPAQRPAPFGKHEPKGKTRGYTR